MAELAQIFVWLLLLALAFVAIEHGPAGLRQWTRAKFLGKLPGE